MNTCNKNKTPLLSVAACSLGASVANGAIQTAVIDTRFSTIDFDPTVVYIDVENEQFTTSRFGSGDIGVFFSSRESYRAKAEVRGYNGYELLTSDFFATRFGFGDTLSGEGSIYTFTEDGTGLGNWADFTGIAYLGFERLGNTGWIELDYQVLDEGGSITVKSFAFGTEGEITQAGVIPEPAHAAALCALVAGSAVAFSRRRKAA